MKYLAECRVCHLLIRVDVDVYTTACAHCRPILIERAEIQERLDRHKERRYTAQPK